MTKADGSKRKTNILHESLPARTAKFANHWLVQGFSNFARKFGGQAIKGIRWMPWHQEAMKDVVSCDKLR